MSEHTITTTYCTYIENNPYVYPNDDHQYIDRSTKLNTGWHIIPNFLWRHYCTPKAWFHLMTNYEAYKVTGIDCTIFNMIPMTQTLAIQQTTAFTAFNNCIYAWGYQDPYYETPWENWNSDDNKDHQNNLLYKEGLICQWNGTTKKRYSWPIYQFDLPETYLSSSSTWAMVNAVSGDGVWPSVANHHPSGMVWDPLNEPEQIMELRPGKNAIHYHWEPHECDKNLWFNLDGIASFNPWSATGPYNGYQRPQTWIQRRVDDPTEMSSRWQTAAATNDFTIPNLANQPLMPCAWWWKEMQQSIIRPDRWAGENTTRAGMWQKVDLEWPGTEKEQCHYPPSQWFIKMIPLFDEQSHHIKCSAMISVRMRLRLAVKPRRSAYYCHTGGPYPWRSIYSPKTLDINFYPAMVRARTAGMRRTWQNIEYTPRNTSDTPAATGHARQTPYTYNANYSDNITGAGTGTGGTYTIANQDSNHDITVVYSARQQMDTTIYPRTERPARPPRPSITRSLSPGGGR